MTHANQHDRTQRNVSITGGLLLMLWLAASPALTHANEQTQLAIGEKAPAFTLKDQNNQTQSLKAYRGQWVVLYFYPKNDTPGCTTEACSFRDNINRLIQQDAQVLGVSIDSQQSHAQFAKKYELPFPLLADHQGKVSEQYQAVSDWVVMRFAKRHTFIIDPQGRIAKRYQQVDPDTHVQTVLDDLKQLKTQSHADVVQTNPQALS